MSTPTVRVGTHKLRFSLGKGEDFPYVNHAPFHEEVEALLHAYLTSAFL
jgi:hypothetical protein